mmetsp:Transcript_17329/g.43524  ORF Transcript_17329/g.43524 Transcript_17329/m.43524 type:complete len:201 (-) Transcript_17329:219-821(-)
MSFSNLSRRSTRWKPRSVSTPNTAARPSASAAGPSKPPSANMVPTLRKPMAPTTFMVAACMTPARRAARSASSTRTRSLTSPLSTAASNASMRAMRWGMAAAAAPSSDACCCSCVTTSARCDCASCRSSSSVAYGCATSLNWYEGLSDLPMPSRVEKARSTKVNVAGKRKGWSVAIANRSSPMAASVSPRSVWRARLSRK